MHLLFRWSFSMNTEFSKYNIIYIKDKGPLKKCNNVMEPKRNITIGWLEVACVDYYDNNYVKMKRRKDDDEDIDDDDVM